MVTPPSANRVAVDVVRTGQVGAGPVATGSVGVDPVAADPVAAGPAAADPVAAGPASAAPVAARPVGARPVGAGPVGAGPVAVPAAVRALAERLGAGDAALPAYVYDLDGLAAHLADIRSALPAVELLYAVKANPDPEVLRVVARYADGLEVASGGELAHTLAAVPGARLAFGGPGKSAAEIAAALAAGAATFHVESPHELRQLGAAALALGRTVDVLLRVNLPAGAMPCAVAAPAAPAALAVRPGDRAQGGAGPGASLVMGGGPQPFGMDPELLDDCAAWLAGGAREARALRLRGLHAHLASGLDAAALLGSAARFLHFARPWCTRIGVDGPVFNLGGGMAVDYRRPAARFDWAAYGHGLARLARPGETLCIEPGRAVTAYCGWYVTRVLDVKLSQGQAFAIVAGGTHHLRTPVAKGHDQPFTVLPTPAWPHAWPRPAAPAGPVTVVGQLCTPKDVLARNVEVPALRAGDLLAFAMAGAYAWNISHHDFLMHPKPAFHHIYTP